MQSLKLVFIASLISLVAACADTAGVAVSVPEQFDALPNNARLRIGSLRLKHGADIATVEFSPDGLWLVSACIDGKTVVWDTVSGKPLWELPGQTFYIASPLAFSPDGALLATGKPDDKTICIWDTRTWTKLFELAGHSDVVGRLEFSPDGKTLASCSGEYLQKKDGDYTVRLWDVVSRRQKALFSGFTAGVPALAWSHDGKWIAGGSWDCSIKIVNAETGALLRAMQTDPKAEPGTDIVASLAFTQDDRRLVSAGYNGNIRHWEVSTGREFELLRRQDEGWISDLKLRTGGKEYISCAGSLVLWDSQSALATRRIKVAHALLAVASEKSGETLATGCREQCVQLWDAKSGAEKLTPSSGFVTALVFSPDGQQVATGAADGRIVIWDAATGVELKKLSGGDSKVNRLYWTTDSFASASGDDKTLRFWNLETGACIRSTGFPFGWNIPSLSPDGKIAACITGIDDAILLDTMTGNTIQTVMKDRTRGNSHTSRDNVPIYDPDLIAIERMFERACVAVTSQQIYRWDLASNVLTPLISEKWIDSNTLAVSPDGCFVAVTSDGKVHVTEFSSGQLVLNIENGWKTAFSRDGLLAISKTDDKSIRVFDLYTGNELQKLSGHAWQLGLSNVDSFAFSPDGKTLASVGHEGTAILWDISGIHAAARTVNKRDPSTLITLWDNLTADAPKAYVAAAALINAGDVAVDYIRMNFNVEDNGARIKKWIAGLDDDVYSVRENATENLIQAGPRARDFLTAAMEKNTASQEVVSRCKIILDKMKHILIDAPTLRGLRAITVLEHIGTPSAVEMLRSLAQSDAALTTTRAAKSALERLGK